VTMDNETEEAEVVNVVKELPGELIPRSSSTHLILEGLGRV